MTNFYGMYQMLGHQMGRYEKQRSGQPEDPHERMLDMLREPYNDLSNYQEFLTALRQTLTAEEAEAWCAYPDYTLRTVPRTPAELRERVKPEIQADLEGLSASLAQKGLLIEAPAPSGEKGYMRNYLFGLASFLIYHPDGTLLSDACFRWFRDLVDGGDSAKLRGIHPDYRILPHEGTLTGEAKYGRIPMNLEIPDTREVIPSIDRAEEILKKCYRFAVIKCLCRAAKDQDHSRTCDYPVDDVCLLFDEVADGELAAGSAKELTLEEALDVLRRCREDGLVQLISNAEHPLCICNCCECCCLCLRSMRRFEDTVAEVSRYAADAAGRERCVGCGACVKICPMEACAVEHGSVQVKGQQCIGCGLCVSRCPKGVLKMAKRPGASDRIIQRELDRIYI